MGLDYLTSFDHPHDALESPPPPRAMSTESIVGGGKVDRKACTVRLPSCRAAFLVCVYNVVHLLELCPSIIVSGVQILQFAVTWPVQVELWRDG